jgi:hypothetical protein
MVGTQMTCRSRCHGRSLTHLTLTETLTDGSMLKWGMRGHRLNG